MSLSSEEAAASLSQAEQARQRSAQAYFYHRSSPHLIMWGAIWVLGYGGTQFYPMYANWIWGPLILVGVSAGAYLGRSGGSFSDDCRRTAAWRTLAMAVLAISFVSATYTVMWPVHYRQLAAYPALLTGFAYIAAGIWVGLRYVVAGVVVVILTLIGYFYITQVYLWMAVVGGGSMILAGLWFRKV